MFQEPVFIKILHEIEDVLKNHACPVNNKVYPTWEIFLQSFLSQGKLFLYVMFSLRGQIFSFVMYWPLVHKLSTFLLQLCYFSQRRQFILTSMYHSNCNHKYINWLLTIISHVLAAPEYRLHSLKWAQIQYIVWL